MSANDNTVQNITEWFDEARGVHPSRKDFHVQLGVHFEEISEMAAELTGEDGETRVLIAKAKQACHELAEHLKANHDCVVIEPENEIRYLDALCDQIVTSIGCAQASELNIAGALNAVDISNYSKFVDGKAIFDANGKIAKGPDYVKADLKPFLNR